MDLLEISIILSKFAAILETEIKFKKNNISCWQKWGAYNIISIARFGKMIRGDREETTGYGSVWLERLVWDQEVAGSNPVTPIDLQV